MAWHTVVTQWTTHMHGTISFVSKHSGVPNIQISVKISYEDLPTKHMLQYHSYKCYSGVKYFEAGVKKT